MKIKKRYNQHRRDLWVDLECENCGHIETVKNAYDDRNYWDNVIPSRICKKCNESSKSLGTKIKHENTKYPDYMIV